MQLIDFAMNVRGIWQVHTFASRCAASLILIGNEALREIRITEIIGNLLQDVMENIQDLSSINKERLEQATRLIRERIDKVSRKLSYKEPGIDPSLLLIAVAQLTLHFLLAVLAEQQERTHRRDFYLEGVTKFAIEVDEHWCFPRKLQWGATTINAIGGATH